MVYGKKVKENTDNTEEEINYINNAAKSQNVKWHFFFKHVVTMVDDKISKPVIDVSYVAPFLTILFMSVKNISKLSSLGYQFYMLQ